MAVQHHGCLTAMVAVKFRHSIQPEVTQDRTIYEEKRFISYTVGKVRKLRKISSPETGHLPLRGAQLGALFLE